MPQSDAPSRRCARVGGCRARWPRTHRHIEQSKCRRDRYEEVTGDDRARVIAQKSRPTLIAARATRRSLRHVLAHRPRRDPQAELQQQFIGDAFFAPDWVLGRHAPDQPTQFQRDRRPSRSRFDAPEQAPASSVPADQRLGPNHDRGLAPIEEPGKQRQRHSRRSVNAPRLDAALLVQREFPAEKEVLRLDGSPTSERQHNEAGQVGE